MKMLTLLAVLGLGPVITNDCDGCPPVIDDSATAVASSGTATGNDDTTTGGQPSDGFGNSETSNATSWAATESPTTGAPDPCNTNEDWCMAFLQWCPFIFDSFTCENAITANACDGSGTIFEFCAPGIEACEAMPLDPNNPNKCAIAGAKCLASEDLAMCGGQPATFSCAYGQNGVNYCSAWGWKWAPGNYCREKCATQEDCGPESYAECKDDGFCSPKVLILC